MLPDLAVVIYFMGIAATQSSGVEVVIPASFLKNTRLKCFQRKGDKTGDGYPQTYHRNMY